MLEKDSLDKRKGRLVGLIELSSMGLKHLRWEQWKSEDVDIRFSGWAIFPEGLFLNCGTVCNCSCIHWAIVCAAVVEKVLTSSTSQWFSKEGMVTSRQVSVSLFFFFSCKKLWQFSFIEFVALSKNISGEARNETVYGQLTYTFLFCCSCWQKQKHHQGNTTLVAFQLLWRTLLVPTAFKK